MDDSEVTRALQAIDGGDRQAADRLLPLVYDELRRLAARGLAQEKPGQTLQATALVHEAYLRLVGDGRGPRPLWDGRRHFYAAAARAMRRILVEEARRKGRIRHGGPLRRVDLPEEVPSPDRPPDLEALAVGEALEALAAHDPAAAELVKLHAFAGLTVEEAADLLGIPHRSAYRDWAYARAWLCRRLEGEGGP